MQESRDPGSTIYTGGASEEDVERILSRQFVVEFHLSMATVHPYHLHVTGNDDYKWNRDKQNDPLFWSVLLDIYTHDETTPSDYVSFTSGVLKLLWRNGLSAVVSCEFEEHLPWSGGIQSPVMPPEHF